MEFRLKLPRRLTDNGILVGWSLEHEHVKTPIGFSFGEELYTPKTGYLDPILFESDGHLMTVAPTGAGKGTGCVIPTLLRYDGPVIVVDPKGENAAVTARRRREMGQRVIVLDPMGVTGLPSDHFNPLDLLNIDNLGVTDDASMLANTLLGAHFTADRDRFWAGRGMQMIIGAMLHGLIDEPNKELTLAWLHEIVARPPEAMATLGEKMLRSPDPDLRACAGAFMIGASETLAGIVAFAQEGLAFARGQQVREATSQSTFSLDEVTRGDPLSIYIVVPPEKLESHARLLRLWISALISAISRRRGPPPKPTLFLLDEAAQLGGLPQLRQAITLLRGYGLRTWSFWQDVSQIQLLYPNDWQTMVNNCKVLQCFGAANMNAASAVSGLTGFPDPNRILDLDYDEMVLLIAGDEAVIAQRPSYLSDPSFKGTFDRNFLHDRDAEIMPVPRKRARYYERPRKAANVSFGGPIDAAALEAVLAKWH